MTGRPPPEGMVVPGDHDVPAGAISRANISSACLDGWSTTTRTIASRLARVRACGPYNASAPNSSMRTAL